MATTSEHFGKARSNQHFLKDRLFLGYQPKSNAIQPFNGIFVPGSDVENQNSILSGVIDGGLDNSTHAVLNAEQLYLDTAEELKLPRSMMINWQTGDVFRVVEGLGKLIPLSSLRTLDEAL